MHASFSATVASWQSFYLLAGTASATLIGLLFVAVSLHVDLIGESGAGTVISLARRTFYRFILVVVVSLLFLVPQQNTLGLGIPLLAVGAVDVARTLRAGKHILKTFKRSAGWRGAVNRFGLPVVLPLFSSLGLIAVALSLLHGDTAYLYWLVPIVVGILTSAATNAWDLMLGLARYRLQRDGVAIAGEGDERGVWPPA